MKPILQDPIAGSLQTALWEARSARSSLLLGFCPWEAVRKIGAARGWLGLASGFMANDFKRHRASRERVRRVVEAVEREVEAAWPRPRRRAVVRR